MLMHTHKCKFTQTPLEKIALCGSTGAARDHMKKNVWIQNQTKPVIINFVSHPNNISKHPSKAQSVAFRLAQRGSIMPPSPRKLLVVGWHPSRSPSPWHLPTEGQWQSAHSHLHQSRDSGHAHLWWSWRWWLQQHTADIISHHKKHNLSFPSYEMGCALIATYFTRRMLKY